MPMIDVSEKDLLRAKIVDPAWYRVRIDNVGQKMANSGKTMNYPLEGVILRNADTGDKTFAGVPTPMSWMLNSAAISFAEGLIVAAGGEWKVGRINLDALKGKEIDVFIDNDIYDGRTVNRINHKYRKPQE